MLIPTLLALSVLGSPRQAESTPERIQPHIADGQSVELQAFWEPCKRSLYKLFERTPILQNPKPAKERATYFAEDLRPFLPSKEVVVGEIWKIDEKAAIPLLEQFAPEVLVRRSHGNGREGAYGCLRATNDDALEILFRTHAYFHLPDGVRYIPAQFEGRLVLGREKGEIHSFQLALPDRDTNVDVNVPMEYRQLDGTMRKSNAADIGWVPRMELTSGKPTTREWTSAVDESEARLRLAREYYAFAQVDWLPFEEAVEKARAEKRPLHVVLLFGSLDDESC